MAPRKTRRAEDDGASYDTLLNRNWDREFAKAKELLEELAEDPVLKELFYKAGGYVESAQKAYNLSLFQQVEHFLTLAEEIREQIVSTQYFNTIENFGIGTKEISGDKKAVEKWWDLLSPTSLRKILVILAVCRDVAKKNFPQLSIRVGVVKVKGESEDKMVPIPVLYLEGKAFRLLPVSSIWRVLDGEIRGEDECFCVVKYSGKTVYVFSREDISPFALANETPSERFVLPNVIEEMRGDGDNIPAVYTLTVLAASLGMKDLVHTYAEEIVKQKMRRALERQEILGEFLSHPDQEDLSYTSYLLPDLRDPKRALPPNQEFLDWLHNFQLISITDVACDISFEKVDDTLLYRAEIVEKRGSKDRSHEFTGFLLVGPWVFKLEVPCGNDAFREALVKTLSHRQVKRKKP